MPPRSHPIRVLVGLMLAENLGDVQDEINLLHDHFGLPRPEGVVFDGFTDADYQRIDRAASALDDAQQGGNEHRGEGGDEHREATDTQDWPERVVAAWCERIDVLLQDEPAIGAHRERNMAGDFPFSPATCALCRGLADIELAAARDVGAIERDPTAAS
jgi:hypothetical protein